VLDLSQKTSRFDAISQVSNPSIPKVSVLKEWQSLTWTVVFLIAPISALNNANAGVFIWIAGFATFIYYCASFM
jgi:hypothetical protein